VQHTLARLVLRRLLWAPVTLLVVMLLAFGLMRSAGGSPFRLETGGLPRSLQIQLTSYYNLDEPWPVEFATYVRNVATFDFGPSLTTRQTVDAVIEQAFPVTGLLVALAAAFAIPVGLVLGLVAGLRPSTALDWVASGVSAALLALPIFLFTNLVLELDVAPRGWDDWSDRIGAAIVLGVAPAGYVARLVRAAVIDAGRSDSVRTARAKGLRGPRIAFLHVLRNSLTPFLHGAVPALALLLTGTFFVEQSFGIPGAGVWFVQAAKVRDYPMVMGLTVSLAAVFILVNLLADLASAALDPRTREEGA
jgi:ABC-type dipeptide/oligopeptide/nickel transport system permease component